MAANNTRPATSISKKEIKAIENAVFPIIVEMKCQFLKALPTNTNLRQRRQMMQALNKAGDVVLNLDCIRFDCDE